jgi:hypothetical protein
VRVVVDIDALREERPLRTIVEALGGDWASAIETDWRIVKRAIDVKRPELLTDDVKREFAAVLNPVTDRLLPANVTGVIQSVLRKASAWSQAKEVGKSFVPSGQETVAYGRLAQALRSLGVFLVEAGELESFCKSEGKHGPAWVNEVLKRNLASDPELEAARQFVKALTKIGATARPD